MGLLIYKAELVGVEWRDIETNGTLRSKFAEGDYSTIEREQLPITYTQQGTTVEITPEGDDGIQISLKPVTGLAGELLVRRAYTGKSPVTETTITAMRSKRVITFTPAYPGEVACAMVPEPGKIVDEYQQIAPDTLFALGVIGVEPTNLGEVSRGNHSTAS